MVALVACYALCCLIWGSTWAVIRFGLGTGLPPLEFAAIRMSLVTLLLAPLVWRHRAGLSRQRLLTLLWIGLVQFGFNFALIFTAEEHVDSGLTAVLFGTYPIFLVVFTRLFLPGELLRPRHLVGIGFGFAGVAMMNLSSEHLSGGAFALFPVAAAAACAYASVLTKRSASDVPPLVILGVNAASGAVALWIMHLAWEGSAELSLTWQGAAAMGYLVVFGSLVAFGCLLWLLTRIPLAILGFITFFESVVAVFLGMLWLDERPSGRALLGMLLVLAGMTAALWKGAGTRQLAARRSPST